MSSRILAGLVVMLASMALDARAHVVTVHEDEPDARPGDGICASADGCCTLRAALEEGGPADLDSGVYELTLGPMRGGGLVRGRGRDVTFVKPEGGVFCLEESRSGSGMPVSGHIEMEDLTVTGSVGVSCASIRLLRVTTRGASSTACGGVNATDSRFEGGGIHVGSNPRSGPPGASAVRCTFADCDAGVDLRGWEGGQPARALIVDSVFENCDRSMILDGDIRATIQSVRVTGGGTAISTWLDRWSGAIEGSLTISDLTVEGATVGFASGGVGGTMSRSVFRGCDVAMSVNPMPFQVITATECLFEDDDVAISARLLQDTGLVVSDSAFVRCGTAFQLSDSSADMGFGARLDECTISGCDVVAVVQLWDGRAPWAQFTACTITDCGVPGGAPLITTRAGRGGHPITLRNVLMGGNHADQDFSCESPILLSGPNLIEDISGGSFTGDLARLVTGVPPGLHPLADNGGPTPTHALRWSSPAIDGCPEGSASWVRDQRGFPRPIDGDGDGLAAWDLGAYEWSPGPDSDADGVPDADDCAPGDAGAWEPPGDFVMGVTHAGGQITVSWPQARAAFGSLTEFDVAIASIADLRAGLDLECVALAISGDAWTEPPGSPGPGGLTAYVARGWNGCGVGGFGSDSSGLERAACR